MKIIEIASLTNGSHRNQTSDTNFIPSGYAIIPESLDTPNFPFGEITVKEIGGVLTVVNWKALPVPEIEVEENNIPSIEERLSKIESFFEKIKERFDIG